MNPSKCVVLVPVGSTVEPECERSLIQLETLGYQVRRVGGYAAIDQGRSQMATDALADGFEELLWIDSDVAFSVESVTALRAHNLPIVCGIYPKKGVRALSCQLLASTEKVIFGEGGGLLEIQYAATGFLLTHRSVYSAIRETAKLPVCNRKFGRPVVPYFFPLLLPQPPDDHWYLGEDYAFCQRARDAGYAIMADTTIRLRHMGRYGYGWEDAGGELPRFSQYHFHIQRAE